MFQFTAQHILVMRLITQFELKSQNLVHSFIFLASADSLEYHDIGFYDFVRTKNGVFSPTLQSILEELVIGKLLNKEPFILTTKGLDTYCALASALRPFEDYTDRCFSVYMKHKDDLNKVNNTLYNHIRFRKVRQGKRIFATN